MAAACLFCSPVRGQAAGESPHSEPNKPKVVTVQVRPFTALGEKVPSLQSDGGNDLKGALLEALGTATDLRIDFSDPENFGAIAAAKAARQRLGPDVAGPASRKIALVDEDYMINTTYLSLGPSLVRVDAKVLKVQGSVQVGFESSLVNIRSAYPLQSLGKKLLTRFRQIMDLPTSGGSRFKLRTPCFDITGDLASQDSKEQMRRLVQGSATGHLSDHATLISDFVCTEQKEAQAGENRDLYLIGSIVGVSSTDATGKNVVAYYLFLGLFRGPHHEQQLHANSPVECHGLKELMAAAEMLEGDIIVTLENPDFQRQLIGSD